MIDQTHGVFLGRGCSKCKAKDAEIERLQQTIATENHAAIDQHLKNRAEIGALQANDRIRAIEIERLRAERNELFMNEQGSSLEIERLRKHLDACSDTCGFQARKIERLRSELAASRRCHVEAEKENTKLGNQIERLRDDLAISESNYVAVVDRNLKVEAVVDAGMKIMPSGHSGECVNDNLYYEPEQITFSKCGRCLYRDALAALDTVDNQGCPTCGDKALDHDREECKRLDLEEYVSQVGGGVPHTADARDTVNERERLGATCQCDCDCSACCPN